MTREANPGRRPVSSKLVQKEAAMKRISKQVMRWMPRSRAGLMRALLASVAVVSVAGTEVRAQTAFTQIAG